jgi:thiosulfate dehydrogenase
MFRGFILGIVVSVLVACGACYLVLTNGVISAAADSEPSGLERWLAETSLDATLRRDAPVYPNPVADNDTNLDAGIRLYATHCAICHGTAAGDSAPTAIAEGENPKPPQLASEGVEDDPEGWTFWKIKHGIRWTGMPAWEKTLKDQQIWTLALFLKHMDKLPAGPKAAWQAVQLGDHVAASPKQAPPEQGKPSEPGKP